MTASHPKQPSDADYRKADEHRGSNKHDERQDADDYILAGP